MGEFVNWDLIRIEGQLLYCFFDYSLGKVVLVVLINKTRFFFVFEEFLRFYGKIFGSKVYLYVGAHSKLVLFRGLRYVNLQVNLIKILSKDLLTKIFVNKEFIFDLNFFSVAKGTKFYFSKYYVKGVRWFSKIYKSFYWNLYYFYLRYFDFFVFFFFWIIFMLRKRVIWRYFFFVAAVQYCFSYFFFFFFFWKDFYYKKGLGKNLERIIGFTNIGKFLHSRNVMGLVNIVLLFWNFKKEILLLKTFLCWLKLCSKKKIIYNLFKFLVLQKKNSDWLRKNYKSFFKIFNSYFFFFRRFFKIDYLSDLKGWINGTRFKKLNIYLGGKFRISNWEEMLVTFSYYYYWNNGKIFGLWFTPLFRKINFRYYLWWLKNLGMLFVRKNFKQFFSFFDLGLVQGAKIVGRSISHYWWNCLFSINFCFRVLFLCLFYDFVIENYWIYMSILSFKILIRNILKFIHLLAYKSYSMMGVSNIYFWVWLNLIENFFNFCHNKSFKLISRIFYGYMSIFFSFILKRFPCWTSKRIENYFIRFCSSIFYSKFWIEFKFLKLYIYIWYVLVFVLLLIYMYFFFRRGLGVGFYFGYYGFDWDLQLVWLVESWEAIEWQDLFKINDYKVFGNYLGKNLKGIMNSSNIFSLTKGWFWNQVNNTVESSNIRWDKFVLLKLLKSSKVDYRKEIFGLFQGQFRNVGLRNPEYFCNFLSGGRTWLTYYWNYNDLVVRRNSLQKFPKEIWIEGFKSLVYGRRMSNLLSWVNFGSDLYSNNLFRLVYRFVFRRVKRKWKIIFDHYFDYYRSKEAVRRYQLGKKVKEWFKLKTKRSRARRWRYNLTKPDLILVSKQWLKLQKDRILYRRGQQKVLGKGVSYRRVYGGEQEKFLGRKVDHKNRFWKFGRLK